LTTLQCYPCRRFPFNSCKSLLFHGGDTGSTPVRDAKYSRAPSSSLAVPADLFLLREVVIKQAGLVSQPDFRLSRAKGFRIALTTVGKSELFYRNHL
jgi:hypothetical protein